MRFSYQGGRRGDEETRETRRAKRRKSLVGTANLEVMKDNIKVMPKSEMKEEGKGWDEVNDSSVVDLFESFCAALVNCSADVEKDIGIWFDKSWPTTSFSKRGTRNIKHFFVLVAKRLRVLVKMSRIGVLSKTGLTLLFSYSDLITDIFVLWSYWIAGRKSLAYTTGSCIGASLVAQMMGAFYQYKVSKNC